MMISGLLSLAYRLFTSIWTVSFMGLYCPWKNITVDLEQFIKIRMPILCDSEKCQKCGVCEKVCPVGAIKMIGIPEFQDETCIQCFCCTELCSHGALKAIRPDD